MKNGATRAPKHLRNETKAFWLSVLRDYELEEHHVRLLTSACESLDRASEAREAISTEGAFFRDRHGQIKPHPGLAVERDNRGLFARLIRELNLTADNPTESYSRPPRIGGR
jgi:phage terminase small subunit